MSTKNNAYHHRLVQLFTTTQPNKMHAISSLSESHIAMAKGLAILPTDDYSTYKH